MYDSHMHTPLCHHAVGDPDEYAAAGYDRGLAGVIFTCHNPLPHGLASKVRMAPEQFEDYLSLVEDARRRWAGRLDVRLGLECDYIPDAGLEDWLKWQTSIAEFDYLLVSIHPHMREYRDRFWQGDALAYQKIYFDHLAAAAELGLHDCLAHPDLVKNVTADDWHPDRLTDQVRGCLDRIAATGLAMELNTSGWNKGVPEQNPGATLLREMAVRHIPVVIGSDAHEPGRVADRFREALDLLEDAGFSHVSYFLNRCRRDVSIGQMRTRLRGASYGGDRDVDLQGKLRT